MKQVYEREQPGHGDRKITISYMEPANLIGSCDVSQRSRCQAAIRHELGRPDVEKHANFIGPTPKPPSRQPEACAVPVGWLAREARQSWLPLHRVHRLQRIPEIVSHEYIVIFTGSQLD